MKGLINTFFFKCPINECDKGEKKQQLPSQTAINIKAIVILASADRIFKKKFLSKCGYVATPTLSRFQDLALITTNSTAKEQMWTCRIRKLKQKGTVLLTVLRYAIIYIFYIHNG